MSIVFTLVLEYSRSFSFSFSCEGELKFFDNYIIPLAQKLKDCNIFGVSSDECLNYAIRNRAEWQDRGRSIVAEYVQTLAQDNESKRYSKQRVLAFAEEEKAE